MTARNTKSRITYAKKQQNPTATTAAATARAPKTKQHKQQQQKLLLDQVWHEKCEKLHKEFEHKNNQLLQQVVTTSSTSGTSKEQQAQAQAPSELVQQLEAVKSQINDMRTFIMSRYAAHASTFQSSMVQVDQQMKSVSSSGSSSSDLGATVQNLLTVWTRQVNQIQVKESQ